MREGEESSRRLWALMGSRVHTSPAGPEFGWRALVFMAHKSTSSSAPVLIDPLSGWETAANNSNWHLIPSVPCLDTGEGTRN